MKSHEEFDALPAEEKLELAAKTLDKATSMAMLFCHALLKYGEHEDTCTDEKVCTCGLSPIQNMGAEMIEHFSNVISEDETLN